MSSLAAQAQDVLNFSTRPSASLGEAGTEPLPGACREDLASLRAIRMQAYQEKHGGPCRRRRGHLPCIFAVLTAPMVLAATLLRRMLAVALVVIGFPLSALAKPHFWLGALAAVAVAICTAWQHCVVPVSSWQVDQEGPVQLICESKHQWARDLHGAVAWTTWSAIALLAEGQAYIAQLLNSAALARDAALWPLFGWCPFRDVDDAVARCALRPELERVRGAADCAALRRAFHEGQRQFHPDHLRLKHPACNEKVLEACSVALNTAMEERRTSLSCPAR